MRDPVHDRDCMDHAAEHRVPVLLFVLGAEDGLDRAIPKLHQFERLRPDIFGWVDGGAVS